MSDERLDRTEAALHNLTASNQGLTVSGHSLTESYQGLAESYHKLTVLSEDTNSRVCLVAEGLDTANERMDRGFVALGTHIDGTNQMMRTFIRQQAQINRKFSDSLSNDGTRLRRPKRRRKAR